MLHLNLATFVEQTWRDLHFSRSTGFILQRKLHTFKLALKKWSREVYGNVLSKLQDTEYELHQYDVKAEFRPLKEEELKLQREKRNEMWLLSRKLEWEWLQKSRLDWNMKGDKNIRLFHVMATSRQNRNTLNSITVGDVVFEEPDQVLKEDVLNFMKDFHISGRLVSGLNSTFITLIPKKEKAVTLNEFSSISLVGSVYKILSEVLASKLKKVMHIVIGDSQLAFLGERNMLDEVLVVNEVVDG
ncbi:uncharacterized protein LOC114295409 [Camellia sinensis]|uniref:uncharacterized protein LOC114295409 n=1 Tax=Camellia sinensis TaxID=4442 RepID=UPI0010356B3A|nr:uncharacterized protein LOC114295409 [Camellia sinensis]